MKMKNLAILIAVMAISIMFLTSLVYAQVPNTVNVYAWTEKTHYNPGEKGVLHIVIRNDRTDEDLILKNISITFPWFAYTGEDWEGNVTMTELDHVMAKKGGVYTHEMEFSIPRDGRILSSMYGSPAEIQLLMIVDKWPYQYSSSVPIYVKSTPYYMSLEDMENIVTLFTVQTVLIIVCTIIIAATIFLSARRPTVRWRETPKPQQQ